jgi:hypothetical protein
MRERVCVCVYVYVCVVTSDCSEGVFILRIRDKKKREHTACDEKQIPSKCKYFFTFRLFLSFFRSEVSKRINVNVNEKMLM